MALSLYNIKKWLKMVTGKSILHVNQGVGKHYSVEHVNGYYNDLTEKVIKDRDYQKIRIPTLKVEDGTEVHFSIAIFQYGLGSYDLLIASNENIYLEIFGKCVNWALENQEENGSWKTFEYKDIKNPYSSMAQGEGASLLMRAYKEFEDEKYLIAAKKAIDFLIRPIEKGGTTQYSEEGVFLKEFTNKPVVLNGWIFSLFGLIDYLKIENDKEIERIYDKSLKTLIKNVKLYDNGYWSKYDITSIISSPFYHDLHIAQLKVMYDLTGEEVFREYSTKWEKYKNKRFNYYRAFLLKSIQKIIER